MSPISIRQCFPFCLPSSSAQFPPQASSFNYYWTVTIFGLKMNTQDSDGVKLEDFQKKVKEHTFSTVKLLLAEAETIPSALVYILLLVQFLQILWYSIHPSLHFLGKPFLLSYSRLVISFFNVDSLMINYPHLLGYIVATCFLITLLTFILVAATSYLVIKADKAERKLALKVLSRLTAYTLLVFNTILIIPIVFSAVVTFSCSPTHPYNFGWACSGTQRRLLMVMAGFILLMVVGELQIYWLLYYTKNPFSKSYNALPTGLPRLGKFLLKVLPTIYFAMGLEISYLNLYCVGAVALFIAYLFFLRLNSSHSFNESFFEWELFLESMLLWLNVNNMILFFFSGGEANPNSLIHCYVLAVLVGLCARMVELKITENFLMRHLKLDVKKQELEKWLYCLISELSRRDDRQKINYMHYIQLVNSMLGGSEEDSSSCRVIKMDALSRNKMAVIRRFMLELVDHFLEGDSGFYLRMLRCRLLFETEKQILSLHEVSDIQKNKLPLSEEFELFEFKRTHIIYSEANQSDSSEGVLHIETFLKFTECLNKLEEEVELCAYNNFCYWDEVCEDIASLHKIKSLALRSHQHTRDIEKLFQKICLISPHNRSALSLYLKFLAEVGVRSRDGDKMKDSLHIGSLNFSDPLTEHSDEIRFEANEEMSVLHVSTNSSSIGTVLTSNTEIRKSLGYEKHELIGFNVHKIMPSIYQDIHDSFIRNYLETIGECKLPSKKIVYALRKDHAMMETVLAVKIFPSLESGFQLVGFFKERSKRRDKADVMVNMGTLRIEGMTKGFMALIEDKINLLSAHKEAFFITQIFPELDLAELDVGADVDTLLRLSDCTDKLINLDESDNQGGKKVRLKVKQLNEYGKVQIVVLSVTEMRGMDLSLNIDSKRNSMESRSSIQSINREKAAAEGAKMKGLLEACGGRDHALERKLQNYGKKFYSKCKLMSLQVLLYLVTVSAIAVEVAVSSYFESRQFETAKILSDMNLAINVYVQEPQLMLFNLKMYEVAQKGDEALWEQEVDKYCERIEIMENDIINLIKAANQHPDFDLVINRHRPYKFAVPFLSSPNQTQDFSLSYSDALLQLIFIAESQVEGENRESFVKPLPAHIEKARRHLKLNIREKIPQLGRATVKQYQAYIGSLMDQFKDRMIYFIVSKTLGFILLFCLVCYLFRHSEVIHSHTMQIYSSIVKWDAVEMQRRCLYFLIKDLKKEKYNTASTMRKTDIFKALPTAKMLELIHAKEATSKPHSTSPRPHDQEENKLIQQQQSIEDKIGSQSLEEAQNSFKGRRPTERISLSVPEDQDREEGRVDESVYKSEADELDSKMYVSMREKLNTNKIMCSNLMLLVVILAQNLLFFFLARSEEAILARGHTDLEVIGNFEESFLALYGFALEYEHFPQDYHSKLVEFYDYSGHASLFLGDPKPTLRRIYTAVGVIDSIVTNKINATGEERNGFMQMAEQMLLLSRDEIEETRHAITTSCRENYMRKMKSLEIWRLVLLILLYIACCLAMKESMVRTGLNTANTCWAMIGMVPVWLLTRNRAAMRIIMEEKQPEAHSTRHGAHQNPQ